MWVNYILLLILIRLIMNLIYITTYLLNNLGTNINYSYRNTIIFYKHLKLQKTVCQMEYECMPLSHASLPGTRFATLVHLCMYIISLTYIHSFPVCFKK